MAKDLGPCQIPGCPKRAKAKGYCMGHYGALWRAHALRAAPDTRMAVIRRFEESLAHPKHREETSQPKRDERLDAAVFNLKYARMAYACASSLQARLFWRGQIKELHAAVVQFSGSPALSHSAVRLVSNGHVEGSARPASAVEAKAEPLAELHTGPGNPEPSAGVSAVADVPPPGRADV